MFSAFAFAGLIVTALMQREELSLQRRELKDTRSVLSSQLSADRLSTLVSAYVAMLEHHERILDAMGPGALGREAIEAEVKAARARVAVTIRLLEEILEAK